MWTVLIQAAIPLGVDLVNEIIALIQKEASGKPLTPDDWNALSTKWGQKQASAYLDAALAKANPPAA